MSAKKRILIVEDNALNRMLLREILLHDYEVTEAENGKEALSHLTQRGAKISLILLDIVMPVMNGYEFLTAIKKDSALSLIPVIVTTQKNGELDETVALSKGAADFVTKPYQAQIILQRIENIIHLREKAALVNELQYDRLTGLYNREAFYLHAGEILRQNPDKNYDILSCDIVNFNRIRTIYGPFARKDLLCKIADLCTSRVADRGICSRFEADQFFCLTERFPHYSDDLFCSFRDKINALSQIKNIVITWGICPVQDRSLPVEQLCDRAHLAAHSGQSQPGKLFTVYDEALHKKLLWEQDLIDKMALALEEGQFDIYLQPIYQISDNALIGAEAQAYWHHPELGLQPLDQRLPLIEQNGLGERLTHKVWDKVCALLHNWDARGHPPLPVCVPVSRADLDNTHLPDMLTDLVIKYRLPPSCLHLEFSERVYAETPNQIIAMAKRLRKLGFVIEMSGFGDGCTALTLLSELPTDILKLDKQMVQSEISKPLNREILRFMVGLAHLMDLRVVAQGVETVEQLERLREIGCNCAQGHYFAKPLPVDNFELLVKKCLTWQWELFFKNDPVDVVDRSLHTIWQRKGQNAMSKFKTIFEAYGADYETTMRRFMGSETMYLRFLNMMFQDESLHRLGAALEAGDMSGAFEHAHALKGMVGNMGLTPLYEAICRIVDPLRCRDLQKDYPALFLDIEKEFQKVSALTQQLMEVHDADNK